MKKHLRYLTTTLATASLLTCSPSHALGIGDMKLQSALNQNLKAEIALILSDGENPADLKIGLAPITKFDDAGIPWTLFLSKIKFQTVTENGKTFIKLSSNDVLKEPFLDFLIEIRNSKSNLYREFTVLIDPPEAYQSTQESVIQKDISADSPQHFVSAPSNTIKKPVIKAKPKVVAIKTTPTTATLNPLASKIASVKTPTPKIESAANNQKVIELEKQLSEMKKTIEEKDAQIASLKIPVSITAAPVNPVVVPVPAIQTVAISEVPTIIPPVVIPPVAVPAIVEPLAVTPEAFPKPVATIPTVPVVNTEPSIISKPDLLTEMQNTASSYLKISADSYYYVAGGLSSLLLSLLGWLRLSNRHKKVDEISSEKMIVDEKNDDEANSILDYEDPKFDDSMSKMFSDDTILDAEQAEFEKKSLFEFNTFVNDDSNKFTNDILFKVDVYCTYGNYEKATSLLRDAFIENPEANHYALRLLKIYVSQNHKEEFKEFIVELKKLGKNDIPEFWLQICDMATDFYPEALIFSPSSISNSTNDLSENVDLKLDVMTFEKQDTDDDTEITFGELNPELALNKATEDFFNSSIQFEDIQANSESESFFFNDIPDTEIIEKPNTELIFDLDFNQFETSKPFTTGEQKAEKAEFDLNFGEFEIEDEIVDAPQIEDLKFGLNFSEFEKEIVVETPKIEELAFDLTFSEFEKEKEIIVETPKIEKLAFDLNFGDFGMEDVESHASETSQLSKSILNK